jgi:hypothetical protein
MRERICELKHRLPLTFIYGELSWVDKSPGEFIKEKRVGSSVAIHVSGVKLLLMYDAF